MLHVWVYERQKFCLICILPLLRKLWMCKFPYQIRKTVGTQCVCSKLCISFYLYSSRCVVNTSTVFSLPHWRSEFQRILKRPLEMFCKNRWCASICINSARVLLLYSSGCMYTCWVSKGETDLRWLLITSSVKAWKEALFNCKNVLNKVVTLRMVSPDSSVF